MPQSSDQRFPRIFVCYRRDDSSGYAGRIFDNLAVHFGADQIFMDIDYIRPGQDFTKVLEDAVRSCEILIAIIGRHWLTSAGEASRLLDNPNDFVRLEIAAALNRDIAVIPVLVRNASMPKSQDLPHDLSKLSHRHAVELSDLRWHRDVGQLIEALQRILKQQEDDRNRKLLVEERQRTAHRMANKRERLRREEKEDERHNAEIEPRLKAAVEEGARRRAEAEARLAETEARLEDDLAARARAEEKAQRLAEELRLKLEEESRRRAEAEARLIEQEVRLHAWLDAHEKPVAEETARPGLDGEERYVSKLARLKSPNRIRQWLKKKQPYLQSNKDELSESLGSASAKEIDVVFKKNGIVLVEDDPEIPSEVLNRLNSSEAGEREAALAGLGCIGGDDAFRCINGAFDDDSEQVRNAAARALFDLQPDRAATFTRALREAPPNRRRRIGQALADSGLASDAINNLSGKSREKTFDAFSLLFLMAKAGEVQPLIQAIEDYPNLEVRIVAVKLLALSGQPELVPAFRRIAALGSLPSEVRSAVMEAIYQISSQAK